MVPKNLHKPGSPKTGLHSWASSTEQQTPISEHSFFLESPKKYKSAAPFFGPPGGPKNWPAKPATFTFPSYPKRRPQKQGRQTDPFLGPNSLFNLVFSIFFLCSFTQNNNDPHSGGPLSGNLFCIHFLALVLGTRFAPFNSACMEAMLKPHWKRNLHWNQNEMEAIGGRWRPHWKCNEAEADGGRTENAIYNVIAAKRRPVEADGGQVESAQDMQITIVRTRMEASGDSKLYNTIIGVTSLRPHQHHQSTFHS